MPLKLNVLKTAKALPDDIEEVVFCCKMGDGSFNAFKTDTMSEDDAIRAIEEGYAIFSPNNFAMEE